VGRGSVVGIATRYWLDGPGIESRWGAIFSAPFQTGSGAHPAGIGFNNNNSNNNSFTFNRYLSKYRLNRTTLTYKASTKRKAKQADKATTIR
jgi:outer membrane translocation and assembly module TamA